MAGMKMWLGALVALAVAGPALAWTPPAQALAAAEAGKVWHLVTPDPQDGVQLGRAVVDINAPPAVVWKLMTDCAAVKRIMPSNRGCRVVSREGRSEVIEHIVKTPLRPNLRTVFRQDLETQKRITITRVEGDMKVISGEWRVQALPGGRTRVSQEMRMQPGFAAPAPIVRSFLRNELSVGMANLRREAEAIAK